MKITQDVIKDLLTVYLAGEATPDTRALVEDWLRTDPELTRQVHQARNAGLPAVPAPQPTIEKRALDRTRRQWRWRAILLGTAVYVSTLPASVTFDGGGFRGLLIEDWLERAIVIGVAAVLWISYWRVSRQLRV
jgi:anti-sigma factor RsiW